MTNSHRTSQRGLQELPNLNFRQLEVLQAVYRENSYTNAAHELHTNRANIKRICRNLEEELGHPIFDENEERELSPTPFGTALLAYAAPLTRSLLHLGEGIRAIQRKGLILRFAAPNEFFRGGAFSYILSRIDVIDLYRPCYLRIETDRYKAALLSSECDVYFGAGISASSRLELIHLDRVPWSFHPGPDYKGGTPRQPSDLVDGKWLLRLAGEEQTAKDLLKELGKARAGKGRVLATGKQAAEDEIVLQPESSWLGLVNPQEEWPCFFFSAAIKKQHPYSELINRLHKASKV